MSFKLHLASLAYMHMVQIARLGRERVKVRRIREEHVKVRRIREDI